MTNQFITNYFGPLPKEYCAYFYILSMVFAIYFLIIFFTMLGYVFTNIKNLNFSIIMKFLFSLSSALVIYFANRLLHTMCINST
jgi:hypothetical protein